MSSPRWRLPDLEFRDTLDENFIGLESSLEVEISVNHLPLSRHFQMVEIGNLLCDRAILTKMGLTILTSS